MPTHVHLVTGCIRVANLRSIAESIRSAPVPDDIVIHWIVAIDDRFGIDVEHARRLVSDMGTDVRIEVAATEGLGATPRNLALDLIHDGWLALLDDDNLLHPAFPKLLSEALRKYPKARAIVFDQDLGGGVSRRASRKNLRVGGVDAGQVAFERRFIGDMRFQLYAPASDGVFIETLFRTRPRAFAFVSKTGAYYNALTPGQYGEGSTRRLFAGPLPAAHSAGSAHFHATAKVGEIIVGPDGDRLWMTADSTLQFPVSGGPLNITCRAWMDRTSVVDGRLRVSAGETNVVDAVIEAARMPFLRKRLALSGTFDAGANTEVEVAVTRTRPNGRCVIVIDGLRIVPASRATIPPVPAGVGRPLWSVVIPTFNCANYLAETLASVLQQDPGADVMQIEVVDDHSADDPESVVRELGRGRVGFTRQPQNVGHIRNFETALRLARGRLVHLLHGDDTVRDGFYRTLAGHFDQNPDIGAAFCRTYFRDEMRGEVFLSRSDEVDGGVLENALDAFAVRQRVQTPGMVVRRDVYESLGAFDPRASGFEDWEMWCRIASRYPVYYEPSPLAEYRVRSDSVMRRLARSGGEADRLLGTLAIISGYLEPESRGKLVSEARKNYASLLLWRAQKQFGRGEWRFSAATARAALRLSRSPRLLSDICARALSSLGRRLGGVG